MKVHMWISSFKTSCTFSHQSLPKLIAPKKVILQGSFVWLTINFFIFMSIINMSWCVRVRQKGFYVCSACENPLFSSNSKYKHGTPWPAFHSPINQNSLSKRKEDSRAYKVSLTNTVWRLSQWMCSRSMYFDLTFDIMSNLIDIMWQMWKWSWPWVSWRRSRW